MSSAIEYTPVPILHLLSSPDLFRNLSVFVKVADKMLKLNFPRDSFVDIVEKLKERGVSHIYLTHEEFTQLLVHLNSPDLGPSKFYDPATVTEEKQVELNEAAVNVAREYIRRFGISKEVIEVLRTATSNIQSLLSASPGLHAFVKRFRQHCSDEYMKINLTNFLLALVINKFSWKSPLIIQKTMLANLLCDVHLELGDFALLKEAGLELGSLPERILSHPKKTAEMLRARRDVIPSEVIMIVEQHHERPDGRGFPYGLTASRFNQLAAIFIVCREFVELIHEANFDHSQHQRIVRSLQETYSGGHFDKAMDALLSIVSS